MNEEFAHIESVLGVGVTADQTEPPVVCLPIPVVRIESPPLSEEYLARDLKHDYETVRKNLRELVEMGKNALDGVLAVAQEGDSPRAYEVAAQMIKTDPHSPGQYRIIGTPVNIDAWYEAFNVKPGDKLYKKPEDRINIW